jgi:uncharacterized protein (DUF2126 family)
MKVSFLQSGGFAGLSRGCELDTRQMNEADAKQLAELVEAAGIRAVGTSSAEKAPYPDARSYRFTVTDETGAIHEAVFTDSSLSDQLMPLLQRMRACSRPVKLE